MHAAAAVFDDVQAPVVALVRPPVQFLFPFGLLRRDLVAARRLGTRAGDLAVLQLGGQRRRGRPRVPNSTPAPARARSPSAGCTPRNTRPW
ncbi:hypothetical protein G6F31_017853 [Rhizopus arrhizus]|nr:hypothetical protein G6F31_017853 [Rhizopus arrhizus]